MFYIFTQSSYVDRNVFSLCFLLSLVAAICSSEVLMRRFYPSPAMTNMEHVDQPRPGSHANKLWNRNIRDVDPDPLFTPKSAPLSLAHLKAVKRGSVPRPTQPVK